MGITTIGWTSTIDPDGTIAPGYTANPWMGCVRVSPGCQHCYAESFVVNRFKLPVWGPASTTKRVRTKAAWVNVPRWNKAAKLAGVRRKVFVASLADVFEDHPMLPEWRRDFLTLLERCTSLDVQLLTKRPENVVKMVPEAWLKMWPAHIWVGATAEDRKRMAERSVALRDVPALVRFLSCEPLLEDLGSMDLTGIDWAIIGGESGTGARPFNIEWARNIIRECRKSATAIFVKQFGAVPVTGGGTRIELVDSSHGGDPEEWPKDLRIREFPVVRNAEVSTFALT